MFLFDSFNDGLKNDRLSDSNGISTRLALF